MLTRFPVRKVWIRSLSSIRCRKVANQFCIEKPDWQFHQFNQKIGNQRNTDSCTGVQHYPASDKTNGSLAGS